MEIDYVSAEIMEIDQAVFTVREVPSWARPIMDFLVDGQMPTDETEARRVARRSKGYTIINKEIYKRSATGVLQRCAESAEGLVTWICPSGTHGLVYRARPIKEVENYKDSKMTWRRRRKALIRIRLGSL
jgi:hypothetical protein